MDEFEKSWLVGLSEDVRGCFFLPHSPFSVEDEEEDDDDYDYDNTV
jgi:hypothetical protein